MYKKKGKKSRLFLLLFDGAKVKKKIDIAIFFLPNEVICVFLQNI